MGIANIVNIDRLSDQCMWPTFLQTEPVASIVHEAVTATTCTTQHVGYFETEVEVNQPPIGEQSSEKHLGFRIELRWHLLDRRHRFRERYEVDRRAVQCHHLTKVAVMKRIYGMESKSRGEYPIERRWATTTLYVSKNSGAGFFPGAFGDLGFQ